MARTLSTGIVGAGEVAQVIHLPVLQTLPDQFEVRAICDLSPGLLGAVGDRYGVKARYTSVDELLAGEDLDCVLVLNSDEYHTDAVVAALQQDVHVLVEKPMCLSPREAERVIAARDASGATVMVGYMRRFAPAFLAAKEKVPSLGDIRYVRVRDIIGRNGLFIEPTARVDRPSDLPQATLDERTARGRELVTEALGDVSGELVRTYRMLCGLGSHDLSALRELVGRPKGVVAARGWRGGTYLTALLDYGDFVATYETGVDDQRRFDAHLEVYGATSSLRVQYDTPFVRHLPTTLTIEETNGDAFTRTVTRPHLKDPYTHELEYFHRAITEGFAPKTSPEDFVADLDLFAEIIRALGR
ncbi:Gfo/Idh/MocA family protein [Tenggerimyces flavus]|uniref:Gfo/Idh/MocA family protein n=1 Tax=Tenggerimyces flavus TaxID=1708749 RepID=A0ABV7YCN0_9ACTN|nr:Gfo/Idh/MocA family oxidoreductase [Tenggerimyces flavus]MBM7783423.1 putative dehydrogenase [Tenggerimyces flavus]